MTDGTMAAELYGSADGAEGVWVADPPDGPARPWGMSRLDLGVSVAALLEGGMRGVVVSRRHGPDGTPGWWLQGAEIHVVESWTVPRP